MIQKIASLFLKVLENSHSRKEVSFATKGALSYTTKTVE